MRIFARRLKWALYTIILPEMTVMIALSQRIEVRKVMAMLGEKLGVTRPTQAQGFYISMGGLAFNTKLYGNTPWQYSLASEQQPNENIYRKRM